MLFGRISPFTKPYHLGDRFYDYGGDDNYSGTQWGDFAVGLYGGDIMRLNGGNDTAFGGYGSDRMYGGEGDDRMFGDADEDVVDGGDGNDYLDGGWGNDGVYGGDGDDSVFGGSGDDNLQGGAGADFIDGGTGIDTLSYWSDNGLGVTVNLATGTGHGGHAQGDVIVNVENVVGTQHDDVLIGDAGANSLNGGDGNDQLFGGAGNDILHGGFMNTPGTGIGDIMTGGVGFDTFQFHIDSSSADSRDLITDFQQGVDIIDLSHTFTGLTVFSGQSADFQEPPGTNEIIFSTGNFDGAGFATLVQIRTFDDFEMEFLLQGFHNLTEADFFT